jgi:hypothetical protein
MEPGPDGADRRHGSRCYVIGGLLSGLDLEWVHPRSDAGSALDVRYCFLRHDRAPWMIIMSSSYEPTRPPLATRPSATEGPATHVARTISLDDLA